jgi:hypothetical protein
MRNERTTIWKMVRSLNDQDSGGGFWLPNIQRPFVWSEAQIEKLFDSIMREYPISTLLVWRTKAAVKHRKFIDHWKDSLKIGDAFVTQNEDAKHLVLDGQQRLQSLMIGLRGSHNGKELCFDITSGAKLSAEDIRYRFRFLAPSSIEWPWIRFAPLVKELSGGGKAAHAAALRLEKSAPSTVSATLAGQIHDNVAIAQFELLVDENLSYQLLDSVDKPDSYDSDDVVEIFIRANAGGTKLGKSDLMFSLLASEWTSADEELEELLEDLNKTGYGFDRDFVLKACLVMLGRGAKYEVSKFRDPKIREQFVEKWPQLSAAIKAVRDLLYGRTFLRSDKAVPSYLSLIPLIYFRYRYPAQWSDAVGREDYVLRTMLSGAFSGTPDNMIDRCVKGIDQRGGFDARELFQIIRDDGRALEVTSETILGTRYGKPLSHLIFNLWYRDFDYQPALQDNLPQQDHLFPQSLLRDVREVSTKSGRSRQRYTAEDRDQIANLALLTAKENGFQGKSGAPLAEWLPAQVEKDPGVLKRHLIPDNPELWKLENFPGFIEARKRLILERFAPYTQARDAADTDEEVVDEAEISLTASTRRAVYAKFWGQLIERSRARTSLYANRTAPGGNWIGAPSGRSGFSLNLVITAQRSRVECYIRVGVGEDAPNKAAFRALMSQRDAIEMDFRDQLSWEPLEERLGCRIVKYFSAGYALPEDAWPDLQDRMIDAMIRLDAALRERIRKLEWKVQTAAA